MKLSDFSANLSGIAAYLDHLQEGGFLPAPFIEAVIYAVDGKDYTEARTIINNFLRFFELHTEPGLHIIGLNRIRPIQDYDNKRWVKDEKTNMMRLEDIPHQIGAIEDKVAHYHATINGSLLGAELEELVRECKPPQEWYDEVHTEQGFLLERDSH